MMLPFGPTDPAQPPTQPIDFSEYLPDPVDEPTAWKLDRRRTTATVIAAFGLIALTGCTPSDPAASAVTAPPAPVEMTDAEACEELTVPMSLIFNVQTAPDGAMDADTARGLYFTAAWELRRIDELLEDSGLDAPVTRLGEAANAVNSRMSSTDDPAEWSDQLDEIGLATDEINAVCSEASADWGSLGWYGG